MPLPTWAAFLANSDRALRSDPADPFASRLCTSESNDVRCDPTFEVFCRFWAWVRIVRNSFVRSCIDVVTMLHGWLDEEKPFEGQQMAGEQFESPSRNKSSRGDFARRQRMHRPGLPNLGHEYVYIEEMPYHRLLVT